VGQLTTKMLFVIKLSHLHPWPICRSVSVVVAATDDYGDAGKNCRRALDAHVQSTLLSCLNMICREGARSCILHELSHASYRSIHRSSGQRLWPGRIGL